MNVNNETLSPQQHFVQQKESVEQNESAVKIEPSEQQLPMKRKPGRPRLAKDQTRKGKFYNFFLRRPVDPTKEIKPIAPPEQWTPCRLRQTKRELVLNRIRTEAKEELSFQSQIARERMRIYAKKRYEEEQQPIDHRRKKQRRYKPYKPYVAPDERQTALRSKLTKIAEQKRRANETPEERLIRVERQKMLEQQRKERLRAANVQQEPLNLEGPRILRPRRKKNYRAALGKREPLQQIEFVNLAGQVKEEDQQVVRGDYFNGSHSFPALYEGDKEHSAGTFKIEIDNWTPKFWLHEQISTESPTQTCTSNRDTQIKKETDVDVMCNLMYSIWRKQYPQQQQQHNRLQIFDNPCTSPSSNYILSTVVWHKLNDPTDKDLNFI